MTLVTGMAFGAVEPGNQYLRDSDTCCVYFLYCSNYFFFTVFSYFISNFKIKLLFISRFLLSFLFSAEMPPVWQGLPRQPYPWESPLFCRSPTGAGHLLATLNPGVPRKI